MGMFYTTSCTSDTRLDNKTVIITGSNSGIGKETAQEFYRRGASVIMACRDLKKAEEAAGDIVRATAGEDDLGQLIISELDLSSFKSIRRCAAKILETETAIHLLVNNAGIFGAPRNLSKDGFEMHFAVNYLGHFLFTLLLLPRIIKSAPGRIVTVASSWHNYDDPIIVDDINMNNSYNRLRAYERSKCACILFSMELGRRLNGTGVTTYSLHPGVVETEATRYLEEDLKIMKVYKFFGKIFMKTPKEGMQTILYCSLDPKCSNETGLYYTECEVKLPYRAARDLKSSENLWEDSIKLVGLTNYDPFVPV